MGSCFRVRKIVRSILNYKGPNQVVEVKAELDGNKNRGKSRQVLTARSWARMANACACTHLCPCMPLCGSGRSKTLVLVKEEMSAAVHELCLTLGWELLSIAVKLSPQSC